MFIDFSPIGLILVGSRIRQLSLAMLLHFGPFVIVLDCNECFLVRYKSTYQLTVQDMSFHSV